MTEPEDAATVFIIDDDASTRESLKWFLQTVGFAAETFDSAKAFLSSFSLAKPGCIVLDVRMPHISGLELQDRLNAEPYVPPILMISGHSDVPVAVRAIRNGAFDFIEKPVGDSVLLERIRKAIAIDRERRAEHAIQNQFRRRFAQLSDRERQVFEIVVTGKSNKAIGEQLGLSSKTIETHRAQVMNKMQAPHLADLVRIAVALGITKTDPSA